MRRPAGAPICGNTPFQRADAGLGGRARGRGRSCPGRSAGAVVGGARADRLRHALAEPVRDPWPGKRAGPTTGARTGSNGRLVPDARSGATGTSGQLVAGPFVDLRLREERFGSYGSDDDVFRKSWISRERRGRRRRGRESRRRGASSPRLRPPGRPINRSWTAFRPVSARSRRWSGRKAVARIESRQEARLEPPTIFALRQEASTTPARPPQRTRPRQKRTDAHVTAAGGRCLSERHRDGHDLALPPPRVAAQRRSTPAQRTPGPAALRRATERRARRRVTSGDLSRRRPHASPLEAAGNATGSRLEAAPPPRVSARHSMALMSSVTSCSPSMPHFSFAR